MSEQKMKHYKVYLVRRFEYTIDACTPAEAYKLAEQEDYFWSDSEESLIEEEEVLEIKEDPKTGVRTWIEPNLMNWTEFQKEWDKEGKL